MNLRVLPLLILLMLVAALGFALLQHDKSAPVATAASIGDFSIPLLERPEQSLTPERWRGQWTVVNIFASWCAPCAIEHPQLMDLAKDKRIALYGIAWKDSPENIETWLAKRGNPFREVAIDARGDTTVALGLSGVPETLLINPEGKIVFRHLSALDSDAIEKIISLGEWSQTATIRPIANNPGDKITALSPEQESRANALARDIRCVVCQGESVAESRAQVASDMRQFIAARIASGDSDEAIRDRLVTQYGYHILMRTPLKIETLLLWFGPLLILALGALALRRYFTRP